MSDDSDDLTARAEAVNERAQALAAKARTEPEFSKGETIAFVGVLATVASFLGAMAWATIKQEKREEEEAMLRIEQRRQNKEALERWINDQENADNKVYILKDGRYLSVDQKANQTTHLVTEIQDNYRNRNVV